MPSEALTWRRLSFSPRLSRRTSRILRMATRGLVNCCSSDGLSEEPAEQGTHLAATELFTKAQPEDISDLAHGDTGSGQLLLLGRVVRGACRAGPTSRQLLGESPQRVYENVGIGVRIRSERVYGMARNPHEVIAKTPGRAGMASLQLAGELFQLGFGTQGVVVVVDRPHLLRHGLGEGLGEL